MGWIPASAGMTRVFEAFIETKSDFVISLRPYRAKPSDVDYSDTYYSTVYFRTGHSARILLRVLYGCDP